MFIKELSTENPSLTLVSPNTERDAPLSVSWMADPHGRETLRLMGAPTPENYAPSLEQETERIQGFLQNKNQYNWMIQIGNRVVGSIWVDLSATPYLKAPFLSVMIGDVEARGKGFGSAAVQAAVIFLKSQGQIKIYCRHVTDNPVSASMLRKLQFKNLGDPYTDADGLKWQNMLLEK